MIGKGYTPITIALRYLRYLFRSRHRNGHGLHSPFLFDLATNAVYARKSLPVPIEIIKRRRTLAKMGELLDPGNFGAGSRSSLATRRSVGSMVKRSSVSAKYGALLYRLVRWYDPPQILEFGTGLGISTMYMAAGIGSGRISTLEGAVEKFRFAREHFPENLKGKVTFLKGAFETHQQEQIALLGEGALIYLDGDHRYAPTMEKVNAILERGLENYLIVLDDIHWSAEMEQMWQECILNPRLSLSIDLFQFGLIIGRKNIEKQHFILNF